MWSRRPWVIMVQRPKVKGNSNSPNSKRQHKYPEMNSTVLSGDFWQLDGSQRSWGTCDAGSPLTKEVITPTFAEETFIYLRCDAPVSQVPDIYFKVYASVLAPLISSPTLDGIPSPVCSFPL